MEPETVDGFVLQEDNAATLYMDMGFCSAPRKGRQQFRASLDILNYSDGGRSVTLKIGTRQYTSLQQVTIRLRRDQLHTLGQAIEAFEQAEAEVAQDEG